MKDKKTQWNPDKRGGKAAFHRASKKKGLPREMNSKNSPRRGISTGGIIFSLGFGYGLKIKTQIVKIRKKLFSTRQMAMISTLIFLMIGAGIYFAYDYTAKGATYGWVQSSWVGGADTEAVATHSTDQSGWTKYHSADSNIEVDAEGNVTMQTGSQDLMDDTDADFNSGTYDGNSPDYWTVNGSLTLGYALPDGTCSALDDVRVAAVNYPSSQTWDNAKSVCNNLCSNCALPNLSELQCICNNKEDLGNNYPDGKYWSSNPMNSYGYPYAVTFPGCDSDPDVTTDSWRVRCVRR